jgi:small-conductance mechanosensitive channel
MTNLAGYARAYFDPGTPIGALILAGFLILVGMGLSGLLRRGLAAVMTHDRSERIDQITLSFLSHLSILFLWVLLAGFYAHLVPALHRVGTALLAGVGLVSVIVGLAAQTTLGNLVAGISLVLYKPFRRGDRLQVAAPNKNQFDVGVVEDITLGFTVLRTDDGREIIVANGTMAQQTMIKLVNADTGPGQPPTGDAT